MKQDKAPLISIIVPVYKVEQYLPTCIESILIQSYTNFELILVDDGSPDNCGSICDTYAQKDSRITVIHQKNAGVTRARESGINISKGEFITFVDSDDTIPQDAIESLCSCISPEIDIIIGKISKSENFPLDNSIDNSIAIIDIDSYRKIQLSQTYPYQSGPYAKLFNKNLFHADSFKIPKEIILGEDWLMNIRISFSTTQNVCFLNHVVYNYIKHPTSITRKFQTTLQYEELFYQYYLQSIPPQERKRHLPTTIHKRLIKYFELTCNSYQLPKHGEKFYSILAQDIKEVNYHMKLTDKMLFYTKNPLLRFMIISLRKFNTLKKYYYTNFKENLRILK